LILKESPVFGLKTNPLSLIFISSEIFTGMKLN
jgi:hypothetical protein